MGFRLAESLFSVGFNSTAGEKSTSTDTHVEETPDRLSWKVVSIDIFAESEFVNEFPSDI